MITKDVYCPYCNNIAIFMTTKEFYGKDFGTNMYVCYTCDAYVGTHGRTNQPLGTLANKELREMRKLAHATFDQLWKSKQMKRGTAYKWMQKAMNLSSEQAHIGMFNEDQCWELIKRVKEGNANE